MLNPNPRLTSPQTGARIDVTRCRPGGESDELRDTMWVAVDGARHEVEDDAAQKLAQGYYVGATVRRYGPMPDGPDVQPPPDPATVAPKEAGMSMNEYLRRTAEVNTSRQSDRCVCFYLIKSDRL